MFIVGFDKAGQYTYNIKVYRDKYPDGGLEKSLTDTVIVHE